MTILVMASNDPTAARLTFRDLDYRCAVGAGGVADDKHEGDRCTPLGVWPLRRVFYRSDRTAVPRTHQRITSIDQSMGWSDDPNDAVHYNRLISLPYPCGHETLWRDDNLYDIVVELGYNDDPPIPGRGSAVFLHVARPDYAATQGCVALRVDDLQDLLAAIDPDETLTVKRAEKI